jgi:hypothetical protein
MLVSLFEVPVALAAGDPSGGADQAPSTDAATQPVSTSQASPEVPPTPQSQAAAASNVNLLSSFPGVLHGYNLNVYDGGSPPDVQLAVGPSQVVEMTNYEMMVFTTAGTPTSVVSLSTVFNSGTHFIGDPRLLYDATSQRFFASVFDMNNQSVRVAVSRSSTVDSSWLTYSFKSSGNTCPDQPFLGVSADKVLITANDYYPSGSTYPCKSLGSYAYTEYRVINKALMIAGATTWSVPYTPSGFGIRPVTTSTTTGYLICDECPNGNLLIITVNGVPVQGVSPIVTSSYLPFPSPTLPPPAPHVGNSDLIDAGDTRILSTYWSNGIWFTLDVGCFPAGDTVVRSCARLVQVSVSPPGYLVDQTVTGGVGGYLFYPAVAVDSYGGVGMVVGYSDAGVNPVLMFTAMKSNGSPSSLQSNLGPVATGTGWHCYYYRSNNVCAYGDYFGAALDPTDSSILWFAGELESNQGWTTQVFSLRLVGAVTMSYSTQDGSAAPSAPSINYVLNGVPASAVLSTSATTYFMDLGSTWTATAQLGVLADQRWLAQSAPSGQVSGDSNVNIVYYHQYLVTPQFFVSGGGSGSGTPGVSCSRYGSAVTGSVGSQMWADSGSSCAFASTLPGSSSKERWAGSASGARVGGSGAVSQTYYHQYLFTLSYNVLAGGNPTAPRFSTTQFGQQVALSLTTSTSGYWIDSGTSWSADSLLGGSTGSERWILGGNGTGTASAPVTASLQYQHQYYVGVIATPSEGGSQPVASGWYNSRANIDLSATATSGWQFQGWSGTGTGAYTGSSAAQSITLTGPINETALFYPGLTITSAGSGSVYYSFGSTHGRVQIGQSMTVYAPKGTAITIDPSPSSYFYQFEGWSGAITGSATEGKVSLDAPASVSAGFGYNYTVIVSLAVVILIAVLVSFLYARRRARGGGKTPAPARAQAVKAESGFCPNCGSPVTAGSAFCNECGAKLT